MASSQMPQWSMPDAAGRLRNASDFKGRVTALYFGFTNCPDACPTTMAKLAAVRRRLAEWGGKLQGIFVTVDPARDSGERALQYARAFDASFIALRPPPSEVDRVTDSFEVFMRRDVDEDTYSISHSGLIYLYDCSAHPAGTIRPELSVDAIVDQIRGLIAEPACAA